MRNEDLKQRILDISYDNKLSHLGSNLSAVDIIQEIYEQKKPEEPFILSSGHAGLALYVVLESQGGRSAEEIFKHHGVHPDRCSECGLSVSTGSLGQGLPIAVGMALSNRQQNVYCLISDGECAEGSIWESLRVADEQKLDNLQVYVNMNGYGAFGAIDQEKLTRRLLAFYPPINIYHTTVEQAPFLKGLEAHYYVQKPEDYL